MREVKTEASSGVYVFHSPAQTLDVIEYSWVPLFVRDQKLRAEITELEREILSTQNSLIDKTELRQQFNGQIEGFRRQLIECTVDSLMKMQQRKGSLLLTELSAQQLIRCHLLNLSEQDIDGIFVKLPQGIKQDDIEKKVLKLQKRIEELNLEIDRDLSPKSRWYHTPSGDPEPYPKGCRWFQLVSEWRQAASRCSGECNFRGELPNEVEKVAYHLLKLGEVRKIEPLHEPQN